MIWWLLACRGAPPAPPTDCPCDAEVLTELVLDRGHAEDGVWISESSAADSVLVPEGPTTHDGAFSRAWATLPPGPGIARVKRSGCGPAEVPYVVDRTHTVVLAYPACRALPGLGGAADAPLMGALVTAGEYGAMAVVDPTIPSHPVDPDGPAIWVDRTHAAAWCAWQGWRLPSLAEIAPVGPEGGLAEWTAAGEVVGGVGTDGTRAVRRDVPPGARTDTIGFRCASNAP